jgi:putative endonuclease
MNWVVYILKCSDNTLYTGITNDLPGRMARHDAGKGAKYTRGRGPTQLIYTETLESKGSALRREREIKALGRAGKARLAGLKL